LAAFAGCSNSANKATDSEGPPQLLSSALPSGLGSSSSAVSVPTPVPVRPEHRGPRMAVSNELCENCHTEVAKEWRASIHRNSWKEPAFQRAFLLEPEPFCQGCHAPEADPNQPVPVALADMGTGCVSCHVVGDAVLAAQTSHPRGPAPHKVVRDGRLDGEYACAGCHEFAFPKGKEPWGTPSLLQSTVTEYRNSPAYGKGCASCHMPRVGDQGHRNHQFLSSRDDSLIRSAVNVKAYRIAPSKVEITLVSKVRGHKFPTGDLFRRLEVLVEAVSPDESVLVSKSVYLGRHFPWRSPARGMAARRTVGADDRLTEIPRTLTLDLGPRAKHALIRYRISYQRVAHPTSEGETDAVVDREVVVASGQLSP
jgi:hypothetical protein